MQRADCIAGVLVLCTAGASAQTTVCGGAATPIPDGAGSVAVVIPMTPDPGAVISDVRVEIDVTHAWLGDLTISVSHDGQSTVLIDQVGSGVWSFGCGGDDIDATFTDTASITADTLCQPGGPTPMFAGDVLPADALSVFDGAAVGGDWTVTFTDNAPIDEGVINSVCVSFVAVPLPGCSGDINGDGSTNLADFTILAMNFGASGLPSGAGESRSVGDLDDDGDVDLGDFTLLAANFGCESS